MQVVTVAGTVGAIAIDATAGWLHGFRHSDRDSAGRGAR